MFLVMGKECKHRTSEGMKEYLIHMCHSHHMFLNISHRLHLLEDMVDLACMHLPDFVDQATYGAFPKETPSQKQRPRGAGKKRQ